MNDFSLLIKTVFLIIVIDFGSSLFIKDLNYSLLLNETYLKNFLYNNLDVISTNTTELNDTLSTLINTSNFQLLDNYIQLLKENKIEFNPYLNTLITNKISTLHSLYQTLSLKDSSNLQIVSPAFLWAEDQYSVHLDILFSHRHNAPGCSEVDDYYTVIYNNNYTFHFNANCTMGDDELYFELDLTLFDKVDKIDKVSISRGKAVVRLEKEKKYSWGQLLRPGEEIPNNMIKKY